MIFFTTLLFEIVSKIGNSEINENNHFDFKKMREINNLSFMRHLPEFNENKNYILVNGNKIATGTILKRPLDLIAFSRIESHYAIVLGTSIRNEEILIEMTKGRNVSIVTKQGFLVNKFVEQQIEIDSLPPEWITKEEIIERAKEFQFDSYDLLDLNCKIFVEYIIWNIKKPQRIKEFKKIQIKLCEYTIALLTAQISDPINEKYKDFLNLRIIESHKDKERLTLAVIENT